MVEIGGLGALIVLVLVIWALVSILGSAAPTGAKVLWSLLVILLPVVGFIVWLLAGPKSASASLRR